jgi:hypothetical protein
LRFFSEDSDLLESLNLDDDPDSPLLLPELSEDYFLDLTTSSDSDSSTIFGLFEGVCFIAAVEWEAAILFLT